MKATTVLNTTKSQSTVATMRCLILNGHGRFGLSADAHVCVQMDELGESLDEDLESALESIKRKIKPGECCSG